jgi:16S rRNA (guanine(966)-N(2))-methyltransferase RsmD
MIRVIAGALKGRRLATPDWPGLRPTSDRLRETLFNVIAARVEGARVVDGYAGTGAVGIEALSRGAAHVTFVERDARAARLIAQNLARCGVEGRHAIIRADFTEAAGRLPAAAFDLVLLDPPYGAVEMTRALDGGVRLLAAGGLLVLERARRDVPPSAAGAAVQVRDIPSGDSALTMYRLAGTGPPDPRGRTAAPQDHHE